MSHSGLLQHPSPPALLRCNQHQRPPLASPSTFLLPLLSSLTFPSWGNEEGGVAGCHGAFLRLRSGQGLTSQQTEGRGLGRGERGKRCRPPSQGLLTIHSSPEAFISCSCSTCLQRPGSLAGTLPPLEHGRGLSPQIFASQPRRGASSTSNLPCRPLGELQTVQTQKRT